MANPSINEITEVSNKNKSSIQASTMKATTNDTRRKTQTSVKRRSQAPKPTRKKISRTTAHGMFGHIGIDATSEACEYLGYELSRGTMKPCNSCREAKAKKEPIPKVSERLPNKVPNQLVFLDISTVKKPAAITTLKGLTKPN